MASKEFLEEMWAQAKKKLPGWLYATLLRNARPIAGGRSSHRIDAPSQLEKIALAQIVPRNIKELSDEDLDGMWDRLEQWFANATKRKGTADHLFPAGLYLRNELTGRGREPGASKLVEAIAAFEKNNLAEKELSPAVSIAKAAPLKRIVYGVVLDPYGDTGAEEDAHDDWNPPSAIEQTAHEYLKNSRVIGLQHQGKANAQVVESWIEQYPTREDYLKAMNLEDHSVIRRPFGTDIIHSGSWILGVELGPEEWQEYLDGKLNAFSPGGFGIRKPIDRTQMPSISFVELEEKR